MTGLPPRTTTTSGVRVERDAEGFSLCRWCKTSIRTGKRPKARTFCGASCVHEWKLRSNPGYQAHHVLERDGGVCAICRIDCVVLLRDLQDMRRAEAMRLYGQHLQHARLAFVRCPAFEARCDELTMPRYLRALERRLWEMDHTLPVVEGGGSCGLDNLRTLCWVCHRRETAALARRRAEARKAAG